MELYIGYIVRRTNYDVNMVDVNAQNHGNRVDCFLSLTDKLKMKLF